MGRLDSPIAFTKALLGLLWRVPRGLWTLVTRGPKHALATLRNLRTVSPATAAVGGVALLLSGIIGLGLFFALQSSAESLSGSSVPVVTGVLGWMTSGWGYVFAVLMLGQGSIWGIRKTLIAKSAHESGYRSRDIERLAEEIRTVDGTTRVLAFADDPVEELTSRISAAFDAGDDERLRFDAGEDIDDEQPTLPVRTERAESKQRDDGTDDVDEPNTLSRAERFALWRKDLASSIRTDTLIWRLLVPAGLLFVLELVLVRFWVVWWLYPVLVAGALLGGLSVWRGTLWWRRRRLRELRTERRSDIYDDISVLVKTVDTENLTIYMGFLSGRRYASRDREQLAETLATRALDRCAGKQPAPAIEERWAWCLERYIVDFEGWRENIEKPGIMDQLVTEVLEAEEGMLPKEVLAERVVEHDRKYVWQGLRFVGYGYDPELVAECYQELQPSALVEREVRIDRPGEATTSITAVRARTETLPPDVAQIRANFSERFPTRKLPDRYTLPDVQTEATDHPFIVADGIDLEQRAA